MNEKEVECCGCWASGIRLDWPIYNKHKRRLQERNQGKMKGVPPATKRVEVSFPQGRVLLCHVFCDQLLLDCLGESGLSYVALEFIDHVASRLR